MNEVYYCGNCRRQQRPSEGEQQVCGKQTGSWYTDRETEQDAMRKMETLEWCEVRIMYSISLLSDKTLKW